MSMSGHISQIHGWKLILECGNKNNDDDDDMLADLLSRVTQCNPI